MPMKSCRVNVRELESRFRYQSFNIIPSFLSENALKKNCYNYINYFSRHQNAKKIRKKTLIFITSK